MLATRVPSDTRPVLMMAADQGKFGRIGEVRRAWVPPGIRPSVAKQIVREYIYAFAAVAPALGEMTALVLPYVNTEMMNLFLGQVAMEFADYFIIMQVDGATYHHSAGLVVPENIRLIEQPARSPELNPTEHIWEEVREKHFYNKVFDSLDAVTDVLCQGLQELMLAPAKVSSMTYFPHLRIVF